MAALSVIYSNFCGMVVSETRNGVESDYVSDTLGSTIGLMGSAGTMTDRWEYWPYGEVVSRTGTSVTPLTFLGVLGYFQDVLSKLFYVRSRHLRVDLARWLTVDSVWPAELAFGYCNNSPALLSDGSGNSAKGTTITINKCCNLTYSYSESYLEIFGVVISSTINFSICLCCCNDFWGLGTASLFGAGWFGGTVLTGAVAALLLEILSGIAALLAIIEFGCYLAEGMPDKTCVGYTGLLVIVGGRRIGEPVFVGTAYCPC